MRSFLAAAFALGLTWGITGCDTPAEPKKETPPVVTPDKPADPPKDKMEGPAPTPTPTPAPDKPAEQAGRTPK